MDYETLFTVSIWAMIVGMMLTVGGIVAMFRLDQWVTTFLCPPSPVSHQIGDILNEHI